VNFVSLCLLGCPCRYDGKSKSSQEMLDLLGREVMVPICPENLAGFPTPRLKIHIQGGAGEDVLDGRARVLREDGVDVTADLNRAADLICALAESWGIDRAYLKERSPSCGVTQTAGPDGALEAAGVVAAALRRANVTIIGVD